MYFISHSPKLRCCGLHYKRPRARKLLGNTSPVKCLNSKCFVFWNGICTLWQSECHAGPEGVNFDAASSNRLCSHGVMVNMFVWGLVDAQTWHTCLFSRCLTVMCTKIHTDQRFLSFTYCLAVVLQKINVLHLLKSLQFLRILHTSCQNLNTCILWNWRFCDILWLWSETDFCRQITCLAALMINPFLSIHVHDLLLGYYVHILG